MNDTDTHDEGEVHIVLSIVNNEVTHLEVLDTRPKWDLQELGQKYFVANINGGDSLELVLCAVPGCDKLGTEYIEVNGEYGVNACLDDYDAWFTELELVRSRGPRLTDLTPTPMRDWLESRQWPPEEG